MGLVYKERFLWEKINIILLKMKGSFAKNERFFLVIFGHTKGFFFQKGKVLFGHRKGSFEKSNERGTFPFLTRNLSCDDRLI